jgi:hypothetical protein
MPTLVIMVLAIAVLVVPLGCAYVIVQRLARRRQRPVRGTGTRDECAACSGETPGKIRDFFNHDGRTT